MGLITPDYGLMFWMALSFTILFILLRKFAWKTIINSIKNREESISRALHSAEVARRELAQVEERTAELLAKANAEKSEIIAQANKSKNQIIHDAQQAAEREAAKLIAQAHEAIKREKESAQLEIKAYTSQIIMIAAERILRKEFENKDVYLEQIDSIIKELSSQN